MRWYSKGTCKMEWNLDGHLAGRMEQYILSVIVQDKAETKPIQSLASSLVTGRMKSFIF